MNYDNYIEGVKRNNPDRVGKKLTLHWDSLEALLRDAYRQGRADATEPIRSASDSMPDFMRGIFK